MQIFLRRFFTLRAAVMPLPMLALLFACYHGRDAPWRIGLTWAVLLTGGGWALAQALVWRRRPPGARAVEADMFVVLLVMVGLVVITGGIESPFALMLAVFGLIAGLHPIGLQRLPLLLGATVAAVAALTLSALLLRQPRPPTFLLTQPGGAIQPAAVLLPATMVTVGILFFGRLGARIRRAFAQVLDEAEAARRQALDGLQAKNHELRATADTIAHEIKNPLAAIRSLAQLLQSSATPGGRDHERLAVMLREIEGLRRIVDEFRAFARPLHPLALREARLDSLAREVGDLLEAQARARGASIQVRSATGVTLPGDPQKLKQALLNLVQNAIEATVEPAPVLVELTAAPGSEGVEISVRDHGAGLSPEAAARLFSPGFSTRPQGSGVGLLVARSIAQQHGGDVTLTNHPDGGCVARLRLGRPAPGLAPSEPTPPAAGPP